MLKDRGKIRAKEVKKESSRAVFPEERSYTQRLGGKEEHGPFGYWKHPLPLVPLLCLFLCSIAGTYI